MKPFNLLSMAVIVLLMVTAVSCTTVYEGYGDERVTNERPARRVYLEPSYGQEVYIVRDPFTGRYYQTTNPYGVYDRYGYDRYGYDPYYRDYRSGRNYRNNRTYNYPQPQRGSSAQNPPAQTDRPKTSDKINEARRKMNQ